MPGFSTKDKVSEYSGRVGMDVVMNNIQAIGGTVHIESQPDVGSAITIKIPDPCDNNRNEYKRLAINLYNSY